MNIHEMQQRLKALYKMDDIDRLHEIAEYLRNNMYVVTYQDTSVIVSMKVIQTWDITKLAHVIDTFNVSMTIIPASDKTFKIFIEKKV
jgi:H2-forming N5,N10-methylenetetrahydromethanopterin dehydrogenase-like enzyme